MGFYCHFKNTALNMIIHRSQITKFHIIHSYLANILFNSISLELLSVWQNFSASVLSIS